MKKNLNIIQIKGFRGILYIVFIGCCLIAGFGWFPGWVCMKFWNLLSAHIEQMPIIGIIQGMLLWGIIAASYFTFRKEKLVVCMKTSEGLSEEELKAVFSEMKRQVKDDAFLGSLLKAQEAELRIKNLSKSNIPEINIQELKHVSNENSENEQSKVQSK